MYDRDYGWPERAREHYRALPIESRWSQACLGCDACTQACPYGFDARGVVMDAHERLG